MQACENSSAAACAAAASLTAVSYPHVFLAENGVDGSAAVAYAQVVFFDAEPGASWTLRYVYAPSRLLGGGVVAISCAATCATVRTGSGHWVEARLELQNQTTGGLPSSCETAFPHIGLHADVMLTQVSNTWGLKFPCNTLVLVSLLSGRRPADTLICVRRLWSVVDGRS
jgi:hypothetical protein